MKAETKYKGSLKLAAIGDALGWMTEFEKGGFVDMFRKYKPDENGHYTWWTYRNDCRGRNIGWRIDYFFATEGIAKESENCQHYTEVLGSDHCPISLKLLK